jgi:hypothetical protein
MELHDLDSALPLFLPAVCDKGERERVTAACGTVMSAPFGSLLLHGHARFSPGFPTRNSLFSLAEYLRRNLEAINRRACAAHAAGKKKREKDPSSPRTHFVSFSKVPRETARQFRCQ